MTQETSDYSASGFFVLRAPLLPIEEFLQLSSPLERGPQSQVQADYDRISPRVHLHQWVQRPEVAEALWIASPELLESLALWWDNPESPKGEKLEQALYRYLARMTARATPFGAFASCSLGEIAEDTRLELSPLAQCRRSTRLDMEYLCSFAETISADPALRSHIHYHPNNTLHLVAGNYHHVQGDWQDGARLYRLVATDRMPALESTLSRATSRATARALATSLVEDDPEITLEEAAGYVGSGISAQLIGS